MLQRDIRASGFSDAVESRSWPVLFPLAASLFRLLLPRLSLFALTVALFRLGFRFRSLLAGSTLPLSRLRLAVSWFRLGVPFSGWVLSFFCSMMSLVLSFPFSCNSSLFMRET